METLTSGTSGWESQASTACQAAWTPLVSPLFAVVNALDQFHKQMTTLIAQVEQIHDDSRAYAERHGIDIPLIEMEWNGKQYMGRTVEDLHQQIAAVGTGAPATGTATSPSGTTAGTSETPIEGGGAEGPFVLVAALVWALGRAQEHHENAVIREDLMRFFYDASALVGNVLFELPRDLPAPPTTGVPSAASWASPFTQVQVLSESFALFAADDLVFQGPPPHIAIPEPLKGNPTLINEYLSLLAVPGNGIDIYPDEIVAMLLAGYTANEIRSRINAINRAGGAVFFISGSTNLNAGTGGAKLAFFWLPEGNWDGRTGNGLQKILNKHATGIQDIKGSDLSCWGIGTRKNPIPNRNDIINLLKFAVQQIADGQASSIPADPGNYGFELKSFKYNGGSCPLDVIFGSDGDIISAYKPRLQ